MLVILRINSVQISGDLIAEELRDEFLAVYSRSGAQSVVIDFQQVAYMSSAGFRPLLSLLRQVRNQGGRLVLCGLRPAVEEPFLITRLINTGGPGPSTFEVQPDLATAVASLDVQEYGTAPSA
jgi:anti-anti-sigma factor